MLVGLVGRKNVGKDTLADLLVCHQGYQKYAFATPLKNACQSLFLLTEAQLHDPVEKERIDPRWGLSPRQLFQKVGTDLFRQHFRKDFWIQHFRVMVQTFQGDLVVSDCRFQNEVDVIKEMGGIIVKIERDVCYASDPHCTESGINALTGIDLVITNNGSPGEALAQFNRFLETF